MLVDNKTQKFCLIHYNKQQYQDAEKQNPLLRYNKQLIYKDLVNTYHEGKNTL